MQQNENELTTLEKPKKKISLNIILVVIVSAIVFVIFFATNAEEIPNIFKALSNVSGMFLLLSFIVMLLYWFLTDLSLYEVSKCEVGNKISLFDTLNIANSAFFFNGITPFSSGGQPFQVYYFRNYGLKSSSGTGIVMMNFIIYQIALTVINIIMICFFYPKLSTIEFFPILVLIGFVINTAILVVLICCSIFSWFKKFCLLIASYLTKLVFLSGKREAIMNKTETFITDFQLSFKRAFSHLGVMIKALVLQLLALIVYYSIPFFVLMALKENLTFNQFWYIIGLCSFTMTFMAWIPTPGASGGAEWAFNTLFLQSGICATSAIAGAGMLIWRLLTYYLSILQGLVSVIILKKRKPKKCIEKENDDREKIDVCE